jgi:hypothetical protein
MLSVNNTSGFQSQSARTGELPCTPTTPPQPSLPTAQPEAPAATPPAETRPPAFLIVVQITTSPGYVNDFRDLDDAASAIAGALPGLLNPSSDPSPENRWNILDVTVYPLR